LENTGAAMGNKKESLQSYFNPPLTESALRAYDRVLGKNWPLKHKCDLYRSAITAFESALPVLERQKAFSEIYNNLRSYWQIFRNAKTYWSAEEVFAQLPAAASTFSRTSGRSLSSTSQVSFSEIVETVSGLRDLKQLRSRRFSEMACSKVLHFFNPEMFPIYDLAFVWNRVFRRFRQDYRDFGVLQGWNDGAVGAEFYARYTTWASHVIQQAPPEFMQRFANWFRAEAGEACALLPIERYFATAFEMVAVGAALHEA
jgi:hypothetical protein